MDTNQAISGAFALLGGLGGTVVLLMPGYVLGAVYSRGIRGPAVSDRAFVAVSALGGVVTHLVGLPFTAHLVERIARDGFDDHLVGGALWVGVVLLILPAAMGSALGVLAEGRLPFTSRGVPDPVRTLLSNLGLTVSVRTQEAWNWVFHRRFGAWVRVRLKEGNETVLGRFGRDSFASSDPQLRDIYIQELWVADENDWFFRPYPTNRGIWISGDQIAAIEFFEGEI